ncbi:MAG TPA: hypothetical protein VFT55_09935 [Planctomycetota bacterium]|nr:hypothetical protein [Planctomycetota bacterium]
MARDQSLALSMVLSAACATPSELPDLPPATRDWLQPFAAALQFVPPGMQSHWLARRFVEAEGAEPAHHWLEVHAGRDFQPTWDVGVGSHVGVTVFDYGAGGITRKDFTISTAEERPPIGGCPVWCEVELKLGKDGKPAPRESWGALVDDRFQVTTTSEALLHSALRRDHSPRFGSLEPLPELPSDTTDLVLRDLAGVPPPTETPLGTNPGGVSAVFAFADQPSRLLVWGDDGVELRHLLRFIGLDPDRLAPANAPGPHHEFVGQAAGGDPALRELVCRVLFGFSVFV